MIFHEIWKNHVKTIWEFSLTLKMSRKRKIFRLDTGSCILNFVIINRKLFLTNDLPFNLFFFYILLIPYSHCCFGYIYTTQAACMVNQESWKWKSKNCVMCECWLLLRLLQLRGGDWVCLGWCRYYFIVKWMVGCGKIELIWRKKSLNK